ncbi:MAP7 domain-containing protein 1-like [Balamuthia mandrillaris]
MTDSTAAELAPSSSLDDFLNGNEIYDHINAPQYCDLAALSEQNSLVEDPSDPWFDRRTSSLYHHIPLAAQAKAAFAKVQQQKHNTSHDDGRSARNRTESASKTRPRSLPETDYTTSSQDCSVSSSSSASSAFPVRSGGTLTIPKEFHFETETRRRPVRFITSEEREKLELAKIPKFKALPLDKKIMESKGDLGIPCVSKRPLTQPKEFNFLCATRKRKTFETNNNDKENNNPNKQQPQQDQQQLTKKRREREPFQLQTEVRGGIAEEAFKRRLEEEAKREREARQFKARPLPLAEPFQPQPYQGPLTELAPFPLKTEERGSKKKQREKERLQAQEEEERRRREFKARDMLEVEPFVPAPSEHPPTAPLGFPLQTEERGAEKRAQWLRKVQEEEEAARRMREFHARQFDTSVPTPAFEVSKSTKPLTEVDDFNLYTDERSLQRMAFEAKLREKERAAEEARKARELEQQLREEQEIKELRKKLVHKPLPVPKVKPMMRPLGSNFVPTEPLSPAFHTKKRAQLHQQQLSNLQKGGLRDL